VGPEGRTGPSVRTVRDSRSLHGSLPGCALVSRARALRGLRRSRSLALDVVGLLAAAWLAALVLPPLRRAIPTELVGPALFASQTIALLLAIPVWWHQHALARAHGGGWYAWSQTILAIALTPVAYVGVWALPLLVESDIRKGVAQWRRDTAQSLRERVVWSSSYGLALLVPTLLLSSAWGVALGLLAVLALHQARRRHLIRRH
jgi:hypothetical protein